jgi:hypothetical protein
MPLSVHRRIYIYIYSFHHVRGLVYVSRIYVCVPMVVHTYICTVCIEWMDGCTSIEWMYMHTYCTYCYVCTYVSVAEDSLSIVLIYSRFT